MNSVRVRFAPSPTGFMHLGNVRAALINFLYARQKNGTFVIRIEDTDPKRNVDLGGKQILADLAWLGLTYQEGPLKNGPYAPYYQSERSSLYQEYLNKLKDQQRAYRCFCSVEELEKRRERQLALKLPPRYDRVCLRLTEQEIAKNIKQGIPFIWRFKLSDASIEIVDIARGAINFDLKHFSDVALTRQDGSFTFIFANFVDDVTMRITHVFRGEDHLSNSAQQADIYHAFNAPVPVFWHLPIICTVEGKKLSKRDFGFSLTDLRDAGFLPEAITNYLAIIGGSFEHEIMGLDELAQAMNFENLHASGQIRYDLEKLKWVNHKWMVRLTAEDIAERVHKQVVESYPSAQNMSIEMLSRLIRAIQAELITLKDIIPALAFCFKRPVLDTSMLVTYNFETYQSFFEHILKEHHTLFENPATVTKQLSALVQERQLAPKPLYALLRIALIGSAQGASISDIVQVLGAQESRERVAALCAVRI